MNVARLNMCHGSHEWHTSVIDSIRRLNKEKGYCVAIMVDTEGSEVHTGELQKPLKAETGAEFTFTVRDVSKGNESGENEKNRVIGVSYDGFVDDVEPGDAIVVDGGMVSLEVVSKAGTVVATDGDTVWKTPYDDCVMVMPSLAHVKPGATVLRLGRYD